jgi:hypothetical protein
MKTELHCGLEMKTLQLKDEGELLTWSCLVELFLSHSSECVKEV